MKDQLDGTRMIDPAAVFLLLLKLAGRPTRVTGKCPDPQRLFGGIELLFQVLQGMSQNHTGQNIEIGTRLCFHQKTQDFRLDGTSHVKRGLGKARRKRFARGCPQGVFGGPIENQTKRA